MKKKVITVNVELQKNTRFKRLLLRTFKNVLKKTKKIRRRLLFVSLIPVVLIILLVTIFFDRYKYSDVKIVSIKKADKPIAQSNTIKPQDVQKTVQTEVKSNVVPLKRDKKVVSSRGETFRKESNENSNKVFNLTAYCSCQICCGKNAKGITATGTKATALRTIAVDPKVIPLGSKVELKFEGWRSKYNGIYIAEDTGSAIKGNIIDLYINTHKEALQVGRTKVKVKIVK